MSSIDAELLRNRLREEIDRFGSIAEAARRIGEEDSLGLRDVCSGRKRLTAELLARLVVEGVDAIYVLTGERTASHLGLDPMRRALLENFDRCSPEHQVQTLQDVALRAAGVSPGQSSGPAGRGTVSKAKVSKSILGVAVSSVGRRRKEED